MAIAKAIAVWFLIILAESILGIARTLMLEPRLGSLRARQIGVFVGCAVIYAFAWLLIRWQGTCSRPQLLLIGTLWAVLTIGFEIGLGRLLGLRWDRITEDYDPARGGLMIFGLIFMILAPLLANWARRNE